MDHTTMIDEIKFLINKYVNQQENKVKLQSLEAEKNMEVLEQLPLVISLRRRIKHLENQLKAKNSTERNIYVDIEETSLDKVGIETINLTDEVSIDDNESNTILEEVTIRQNIVNDNGNDDEKNEEDEVAKEDQEESEDDSENIKIYTDGACKNNPGNGGWGALIINGDQEERHFGGERDTTNNKMELLATIKALEVFNEPIKASIFTDSKYVKDGITEWIINWKKNEWKNSQKKEVKNIELWKKLDHLCNFHNVEWCWVKGHSDNKFNNIADFWQRRRQTT